MGNLRKRGEMREKTQQSAEIIDLAALREKRLLQRSLADYETYLRSLSLGHMEGEAHYLLEEFSGQNFGPDYLQRVQLLLAELASRADHTFAAAILKLQGQLPTQLS